MNKRDAHPLREVGEGGLGFCYDSDRDLFLASELDDGPLVVALDTNIVSDLLEHGSALLNGDPLPTVDPASEEASELLALGWIIEAWMARDIRFVPLARSLDDARKGITDVRRRERSEALNRLAESLAFQTADWTWDWGNATSWKDFRSSPVVEADIPGDADRELVRVAGYLCADVFLTRDKRILRAASRPHIGVNLLSPSDLVIRLRALNFSMIGGGIVDHPGCIYRHGLPLGDTGKWVGLLQLMSQRKYSE